VIKLQENILTAGSARCAETIGNHLTGNVDRLLDRHRMPTAPPDQVPFDVLLVVQKPPLMLRHQTRRLSRSPNLPGRARPGGPLGLLVVILRLEKKRQLRRDS